MIKIAKRRESLARDLKNKCKANKSFKLLIKTHACSFENELRVRTRINEYSFMMCTSSNYGKINELGGSNRIVIKITHILPGLRLRRPKREIVSGEERKYFMYNSNI